MIISVQNEKGGVGKTTLSTALAHALVIRADARVLLVDADPQGTVTRWAAIRAESKPLPFALVQMAHGRMHRDIEAFVPHYDFIVIDAPPRSDAIAESCMTAADYVLIPVTPSYYDVWATESTVKLLRKVREARDGFPLASIVLNRVRLGTVIERDVYGALAAFSDVDLLECKVMERTMHQLVTRTAQTVIEAEPAGPAAQEAEAVVSEVLIRAQTGVAL